MATNGLLNFNGTNKATFVGANSNIVLDTVNSSLGIGITGTDAPSSNLYITGNAYVSSDLTVSTNTLHVDTTNSRVGVGTVSPVAKLNIQGTSEGAPPTSGGEGTSNGIFRLRDNFNVALDIGTLGISPWTTWLQVADTTTMGTGYPLSLNPNGGNVGIGRNNPACALDIAGEDVMIRGNTPSLNFSEGTGAMDGTFRIRYDGANQVDNNNFLAIQTGTNFGITSLHCTYGGNVGIGTSTINERLQIAGNIGLIWSNDTRIIMNYDNSYRQGIELDAGTRNMTLFSTTNDSGGSIVFKTRAGAGSSDTDYGTERMRITSAGNVGIGTTSPSATLELFKGFASTGLYDTATLKFSTTNTTNNWDVGSIRGAVKLNAGGTSGYPGGLVFATKSPSGGADGGLTDKMVIDANGNVGIGTTTPRTNLHIGQQLNSQGDKNTIPAAGLGISADFPSSTHAWFAHRVNATGDEYWGLAVGTIYDGASYLQNLNKNSGTYYDLLLQPNGGNVGIGTTDPGAKFQVNGLGFADVASSSRSYFFYSSTGLVQNTGTWGNASIYATDSIVTGSYIASIQGTVGASDERIKKEVSDINDGSALETLRLLKPKQYKYKDEISRGTDPVWGFIAQEVRETLPYATQIRSEYLPNIYELATVSSSNVITFTNFNTSNLMSNANTISLRTVKGTSERVNIVEVVDEQTIRVDKDLSESIGSVDESGNVMTGNEIFVYGQEVDDFVYLKKDAIWTIATAALQEVDRQLQTEKARNDSLEARILALENA